MLLSSANLFTFNQDSELPTPALYFDPNKHLGGSAGDGGARCEREFSSPKLPGRYAPNIHFRLKRQ